MAAGLLATLALGLGACQLFAVPGEQIQSFADAWGEVRKINGELLQQYEVDIAGREADAGGAVLIAARFPPPLPALVPAGAPAAGDEDVAARERALAAVDRYNEILLAIRDNRPLTQTRQLTQSFARLLLTGLGTAAGAVGLPAGALEPVVDAIRQARTRAEIVRALRLAQISDEAYRLLLASAADPAGAAAQELAAVPEERIACTPPDAPSCVSLIRVMLELMRADVDALYAAREVAVLEQRQALIADLGELHRGLMRFLRTRQAPAPGSELAQAQARQQAAYEQILQAFDLGPASFPSAPAGAVYDQAAEDFVAGVLIAAAALDERDMALAAGLAEYRSAALRYRDQLLPQAAVYFEQIQAALESAPDLLGVATVEGDTIVPLVRSLIDGSTDVRVLLRTAVGLS
jgi:hypothetical protein